MIKSRTQTVTNLGVANTRTEYRLTKGATRRVQVTEWLAKAVGQDVEHEAGTVVLHLMTGKGHATNVLDRVILAPGTAQDVIESAAARLLAA